MRTGAVLMIDALGFKGIWDTVEPSVVLKKMHNLERAAEDEIKGVKLGPVSAARVASLSDTIVIGVALGQSDRQCLADLVRHTKDCQDAVIGALFNTVSLTGRRVAALATFPL
jgi:hypothetical protein